nr:AMP-binding protein [Pantoea ananatis]
MSAQIVLQCANQGIDTTGLFIFVIRNNFEGMLCYFVASLLKVRAAIVNVRDVETINSLLNEDAVAAFIRNHEGGLPVSSSKTLLIHFVESTAFKSISLKALSPFSEAYFYFMTSGTTGRPKLVQYQEQMLIGNALEVSRYLSLASNDNILCFFPVQYMYGLSTMLTTLICQGNLVFEQFSLGRVSEMLRYHHITTMPVIGDWMLPLSKILSVSGIHLMRVLNASDRLLSVQAEKIMPCCDVLWNNFGQTESGPRLFCLKLETLSEIEKYSLNSVVAPGYVMNDSISIQLHPRDELPDGACQMFYRTPFAADGYVDEHLTLIPRGEWIYSGDLFVKNMHDVYFWIAREKNELKINGKFVPVQAISNDLMREFGALRHTFSKGPEGIIHLHIESEQSHGITSRISQMLSDSWHRYAFAISTVDMLPTTHTGKIKAEQI